MKSLVVYDSFFGNTEKIAQAIGKGLGTIKNTQVVKVDQFAQNMLEGIECLVVGSPTRRWLAGGSLTASMPTSGQCSRILPRQARTSRSLPKES